MTIPEFTVLKYNLLSDYGNGKLKIPIEYLSVIIDFMQTIEEIVRGKKQALIVSEPYSVAISMLFAYKANAKAGFNVQVFTTEKAALEWLEY